MLRDVPRVRTIAAAITCLLALPALTGCASKRFVPRIVSESVVIRDVAKPVDGTPAPAPHVTETVRPTTPATNTVAAATRRWLRRAIGTTGIGEREWKGSLEETFGAIEEPSTPTAQPSKEQQETEPAPVAARLASVGDSGLLLAIVAVGCALGAFIYRYRVY